MGRRKRKSSQAFAGAVTTAAAQAVADILRRDETTAGAKRKAAARYENARPNSDTAREFQRSAFPQPPLQLANPVDRASFRRQARQCCESGPHAGSMARLFALYVVGAGARLRFLRRGDLGVRFGQVADDFPFVHGVSPPFCQFFSQPSGVRPVKRKRRMSEA